MLNFLKARRYCALEWSRSNWENSSCNFKVRGHGRDPWDGDSMGSVEIWIAFGSLLSVIVVAVVRWGRAFGRGPWVGVGGRNPPVVECGLLGALSFIAPRYFFVKINPA